MKKWIIRIIVAGILIGGATVLYIFNAPHRNAQNIDAEFTINASALAFEFINDKNLANNTYLSEDGDSKVGIVVGEIVETGENAKGETYVILKNNNQEVGVQCAFTEKLELTIGSTLKVKGVIRSGAEYDEDFEEYIDVIMEQCAIINN
ncbi:MAG: hypothetical protein H8E84_08370 [Flavobacteriales bacterium]|nr:hypothetical protein [Flavobacteriales bacterium]